MTEINQKNNVLNTQLMNAQNLSDALTGLVQVVDHVAVETFHVEETDDLKISPTMTDDQLSRIGHTLIAFNTVARIAPAMKILAKQLDDVLLAEV